MSPEECHCLVCAFGRLQREVDELQARLNTAKEMLEELHGEFTWWFEEDDYKRLDSIGLKIPRAEESEEVSV